MSEKAPSPSTAHEATRARRAATPEATLRAATPRAPDSLGRLQRAAGNQAIHRLLRSAGIQPKLTVNRPDDEYEREADRVADEVMRMPATPLEIERRTPTVQRTCATCGAAEHEAGGPGPVQRKCAACEAEEDEEAHGHVQAKLDHSSAQALLRVSALPPVIRRLRHAVQRVSRKCASCTADETAEIEADTGVQARSAGAVPAVSAALESYLSSSQGSGRPLAPATRAFFEPRFNQDFEGVRVHDDTRAAHAAAEINARAFTLGANVYFASGQFRPGSPAGDRLLGHELTHVVQQGRDQVRAHHTLARDWNECEAEPDCPPRLTGERERSEKASLQVGVIDAPESGEIVSGFPIGSSRATALASDPVWKAFVAQIVAEDSRWEILGFSDCQGKAEQNTALRKRRAESVRDILPPAARAKIDSAGGAPLADCVASNDVEKRRAFNRAVVFRRTSSKITFPDEKIEGTLYKFVCGPNVTTQVIDALAGIATAFAGWTKDERSDACDALDSFSTGSYAWDIVELHNNAWIYQKYRPTCATVGATPACGSSIQVGADCHYAGSVNYVIFGRMCSLCADHYRSIPLINTGVARFTKKAMVGLINLYKGGGITGLGSPSANLAESVKWAEAGYDGWPAGGKTPAGDRNNCTPMCPTKYAGPTFRVNWHPHQFYTGS